MSRHDTGSEAAAGGSAARPASPAGVLLMLLTIEQLAASWGISVRRAYELRGEPWFPKPIDLGPRLQRYSRIEAEQAIAHMPRVREATEPAALARARIDRMKKAGKP